MRFYWNKMSCCVNGLPVQLVEGVCCAPGDGLMKDSLSVMGLRVGFLEAFARELYSERSTSLFHLRVAVAVFCEETVFTVRKTWTDTFVPIE